MWNMKPEQRTGHVRKDLKPRGRGGGGEGREEKKNRNKVESKTGRGEGGREEKGAKG